MDTEAFLSTSYTLIRSVAAVPPGTSAPTLPSTSALSTARSSIPSPSTPNALTGRGPAATLAHLTADIAPALAGHNRSGRYYGFVTGSTLPVAEAADNLVSALDNSLQVHLPGQSVATEVEDVALRLLLRLLGLDDGDGESWAGRTFTTGATASNVLGLACGREAVISARLPGGGADGSVGELGLLGACAAAGVKEIQVLTSMGHSSLSKAASIVGLGRHAVKELRYSEAEPWRLDLDAVEKELQREGVASIIAVSAGEVNTGRFATTGFEEMRRLRDLADKYKAWIHVDGAFGIFARALPAISEFARLREFTAGLELADSITVDGHKLLNVPYDTGIFFTRSSHTPQAVFQNPNAVYLSTPTPSSGPAIPSPLNIGLENSRRFRALPVYAVLVSEGAAGVADMLARMVRLARGIAGAIARGDELRGDYELLPEQKGAGEKEEEEENTHIVVLFRARDPGLNAALVEKIQASGDWYVSGTKWEGQPACRIAVASWRVNVDEDLAFVKGRLAGIAKEWKDGSSK
ncbi:L-2,4-diaminobutyrate decarboxylase [Daldinia childiae]|uniref:L-2,4-diaminobutyrate decarboxylase n=1 Tax=Daldinia childiae TaxID=326645 RepID=UPI001445EA4B|nr:L-2,4-diaminobutyrate decarboxylase [Daldinia childiae]KAF3058003.1 L-2,4-diaminobutyrate decarboxylase [Daldinia childiae]